MKNFWSNVKFCWYEITNTILWLCWVLLICFLGFGSTAIMLFLAGACFGTAALMAIGSFCTLVCKWKTLKGDKKDEE